MKICCFAGHATLYDSEEIIKQKLKKEIINLIEKENVTTFYSGGKGAFDWLCAGTLKELKKDYSYIKSYLILAYIPKERGSPESRLYKEMLDKIIYPEIENVPKRFAILKRNEYTVNESNFLIAYVRYPGGALKILEYAEKRRKIKIINIAKEE